jgi:PAS domain S-box-containing protein
MTDETPQLELVGVRVDKIRSDLSANLVEHCNDLLCSHTLDGRLLSANSTPAKLLGYTVEEMLRIPMRELLAPEALDEFEKYLVQIRQEGTASGYMILLTRTGERRTWQFRNTLLTTESGSQIVLGTARDVTDQRRAEFELREAELQFRASAEILRRKLQQFIESSLQYSPLPHFPDVPAPQGETLRARERDYIVRVLRETRGIISGPAGAASRLGVKRTTLQSKMKQLGISRAELLG